MVVVDYITANWEALLQIGTSLIAACATIAALTPTPADDNLLGKLYKIIDLVGLNVLNAKSK